MRIATFNVNSIKAHLEQVLTWTKAFAPDVLCLQEIKCVDENFPRLEFEAMGYQCALFGQKTYNGVALLSKFALEDITRGLPGFEDEQSRYIEAMVMRKEAPVRVASIYLPNGNPSGTEKYAYKLAFMEALRRHAKDVLALEEPTVLAGDYNVIQEPCDVYDPDGWREDALFRRETRLAFAALANQGWTDAYRARHGEPNQYSFWDYQAGAWAKNWGLRIDHLLLSPQAADRLTGSGIEKAVRGWERPSDHVPVWCALA
ncbi:MAG: exodeoxyribonuclease III [Alphaproteobacteria bacterium]|nr:exodeoxyribonuclease III [Alphaproteobacteria bacterium]